MIKMRESFSQVGLVRKRQRWTPFWIFHASAGEAVYFVLFDNMVIGVKNIYMEWFDRMRVDELQLDGRGV